MKTRNLSIGIVSWMVLVVLAIMSLQVYSSGLAGYEAGKHWNESAFELFEYPDSSDDSGNIVNSDCHAVGYAHLDPCWRWSINEGINKMRNTSRLQLNNMEYYPNFKFSFDNPCEYEWMEIYNPEIFAQIKHRVKEGRWEPFGGFWSDPLTDLVDGEALVRQWLIGKRYYKDKLGFNCKVGANLDNYSSWPGGNIPQIAKKCGIEYYSFCRGLTNTNGKFFWWEGNDGTRIFSHDTDGWFNSFRGMDTCSSTIPALKYYGAGDGGGGPNNKQANTCAGTNNGSRLIDFFEDAEERGVPEKTNLVAQGYCLATNGVEATGILSHRSYMKWYNRKCICSLMETEKFSTLALNLGIDHSLHQMMGEIGTQNETHKSYLGASKDGASGKFNYPQHRINEVLKKYLFWQHHDNLPGNFTWDDGVSASYNDYEYIYGTYNDILNRALRTIAARVNTTGEGTPVLVFNSLSWDRAGIVEVSLSKFDNPANVNVVDIDGNIVHSQVVNSDGSRKVVFSAENIPATGYKEYRIISVDEPAQISSTGLVVNRSDKVIENQYYRLELDENTGWFKSIYDKINKREVLSNSGKGNCLGYSEDDKWPYGRRFDEWGTDFGAADNIEIIEAGPVRAKIRVTHGPIHQDIMMYPKVKRIDCYTWSNNYKSGGGPAYLRVVFPLNISKGTYTTEAPYGYSESPDKKTGLEKPTLSWQDLSTDTYGVSILNDSKYGGDIDSNKIKLSLINHPEFDNQRMLYSIYPHSGDWREGGTVRESHKIDYPLVSRVVKNHTGDFPKNYSFLKADPDNIMVSVVKKHEDNNDIIVRFYETSGKQTTANLVFGTTLIKAWEEDMMEWDETSSELKIIDDNTLKINVKPYEIKTLRIRPSIINPDKLAPD